MNKRIFKTIHLWLSIPFGLIIVMMCLSGAILLFERDFGHIGQAEVPVIKSTPLPLDSILVLTERQIPEEKKIVGVTTYPDPAHAYKIMLNKPTMAAVWINQYNGELMGNYNRAAIFKIASSAHRRLFGQTKDKGGKGATIGKYVIGISTIATFLIIISGIVLWFPKKGQWGSKLKISMKKGTYRFLFDFHCMGGIIASTVMIICVMTGLNWSFDWYRNLFYSSLGSEVAKLNSHKTPAENFNAWQVAYNNIKESNPDKEIRIYQGEIDVVPQSSGNQQGYDSYEFDKNSGAILKTIPYENMKRSSKIKGWINTLHMGSWAGWFSKFIYLISVILGATLPITGYYLWIRRIVNQN